MKKLIFTIASLVALGASAQKGFVSPVPKGNIASLPVKSGSSSFNKVQVIDWYNPIEFFERSSVGGSLTRFVNFLYHDSLAVFVDDDGSRDFSGATSVGQILDPKDDLIDLTDNSGIRLSKYVSYTVDSIRFTYLYVRNVDFVDNGSGGTRPIVDTLFIAYYRGNQIQRDAYNVPGKKNAIVGWTGGSVRMPSNVFKIDTVLFAPGTTDSTQAVNNNGFENSWSLKSFTRPAPAGMTIDAQNGINANNLVGATITFKSGVRTVETVLGVPDTAIMVYQLNPNTLPAGARRTNYFGYLTFNNQGTTEIERPTYFTNSLISYPQYAYATTGLRGYLPGHLYNVEQYIDMDFHLTTSDNVGLKDADEIFAASNVYPNPATVNGKAFISFNLRKAGNVAINIYTITGQLVKSIPANSIASGEHTQSLDINGLKAGVYFVSINVNGQNATKKLTITE